MKNAIEQLKLERFMYPHLENLFVERIDMALNREGLELLCGLMYIHKQVPFAKSNYDAMKVLAGKVVSKLEIAQREGKIKFTTSERFYRYGMQGKISIEKISD